MRKVFLIIVLLLSIHNVSAKDTVFSINKYDEENLTVMEESYNTEQKQDGFIVAGTIMKEKDDQENEYKLIVMKYKRNGSTAWTYYYDKSIKDNIIHLSYLYDENQEITGYLVIVELLNKEEDTVSNIRLLKIDLNGELLEEKISTLEENELLMRIIPINKDNKIDGYIGISNVIENDTSNKSKIIKFNNDLDVIWTKNEEKEDYLEIKYSKIIELLKEDTPIGYLILRERTTIEKERKIDLIKVDLDGNNLEIVQSNLEKYQSLSLLSLKDGYLLYGLTEEVKLKNGKYSYFINKYSLDEQLWELIGDVSLKEDIIQMNKVDDTYLLLYKNSYDNSYEVVKVTEDGLLKKKVKKLHNDYYKFHSFLARKDILYFVGQMNCPEDDFCDYDKNSLFLISDEDKVIEVKEKDNNNILIGTGILFILIVGLIIFKKKRRLVNN